MPLGNGAPCMKVSSCCPYTGTIKEKHEINNFPAILIVPFHNIEIQNILSFHKFGLKVEIIQFIQI